jgi:hypothetical protein
MPDTTENRIRATNTANVVLKKFFILFLFLIELIFLLTEVHNFVC